MSEFRDIGVLPTYFKPYTFNSLRIRPFYLAELKLLASGQGTQNPKHIIQALDQTIDKDIMDLTEGDLEFIMAWHRLHSYPEGPLLTTWTCNKVNIVHKDSKSFYHGRDKTRLTPFDMDLKDLEYEACNTKNTEIVHQYSTTVHTLDEDFSGLPHGLNFPTVRTLVEQYDLVDDFPELEYIANHARWFCKGNLLDSVNQLIELKPTVAVFESIAKIEKHYRHGISDTLQLTCNKCGNFIRSYKAKPDLLRFFANNTEKSLMTMQYTLLSEFGMAIDDHIGSKEFLFAHSSYAKDKQEAEQKAKAKQGR